MYYWLYLATEDQKEHGLGLSQIVELVLVCIYLFMYLFNNTPILKYFLCIIDYNYIY